MKPIPAVRVDRLPEAPGEYKIVLDDAGRPGRILFACPCGCGSHPGARFKPSDPNGWDFAGTVDKPTITPSILVIGGCAWHGYLTDGIFTTC